MNRQPKKTRQQINQYLDDWSAEIEPAVMHKLNRLEQRRNFIRGTLRAGAIVASMPLWSALSACDRKTSQQEIIGQAPWQTFAAVQQQLFPDDGNGPSAQALNATLYLKYVLEAADTDQDDKKFILDGVKWLNGLTDKMFGKTFITLDTLQQDSALKKISQSDAGERWLSHLLLYIVEALLTDPVYGGNPNGVGWQWLEHQPGFPRPSLDKRYTEL